MDFLEELAQAPNIGSVAQLCWMLLLRAIKGKNKRITLYRRRGEKGSTLEIDGQDAPPAPVNLFPEMIFFLRHLGRDAGERTQSAFSFTFTETQEVQKLEWYIDYSPGCHPAGELSCLMKKIDAEEVVERALQVKATKKRQRLVAGVVVAVAVFFAISISELIACFLAR